MKHYNPDLLNRTLLEPFDPSGGTRAIANGGGFQINTRDRDDGEFSDAVRFRKASGNSPNLSAQLIDFGYSITPSTTSDTGLGTGGFDYDQQFVSFVRQGALRPGETNEYIIRGVITTVTQSGFSSTSAFSRAVYITNLQDSLDGGATYANGIGLDGRAGGMMAVFLTDNFRCIIGTVGDQKDFQQSFLYSDGNVIARIGDSPVVVQETIDELLAGRTLCTTVLPPPLTWPVTITGFLGGGFRIDTPLTADLRIFEGGEWTFYDSALDQTIRGVVRRQDTTLQDQRFDIRVSTSTTTADFAQIPPRPDFGPTLEFVPGTSYFWRFPIDWDNTTDTDLALTTRYNQTTQNVTFTADILRELVEEPIVQLKPL